MNVNEFNKKNVLKIIESAKKTKYYSHLLIKHGIMVSDKFDYYEFKKIPITTKSDYRNHTLDFICEQKRRKIVDEELIFSGCDYKKIDKILLQAGLNLAITSGSTGEPLKVIHSVMDDRRNYFTLNLYRKHIGKIDFNDKYIWLVPMNEKTKTYFYDKSTNYLVNKNGIDYFIAKYDYTSLEKLHKIITDNKITWITASPSAMVEYAKFLLNNKLFYTFKYIELHSEMLYQWQEYIIEKVFGKVYVSIYSSNEINFIAATNKCNNMHILKKNVFVELEKNEFGKNKVIVTGLNYLDTPFIRYEIGDLANVYECSICGEETLELLEYRQTDLIKTQKGKTFEPYIIYDSIYFLCEKYDILIKKYTVIQKSNELFVYYLDIELSNYMKRMAIDFLRGFIIDALTVQDINVEVYNLMKLKQKYNKYRRFISEV